MADAFGVAEIDCLAYVETEAVGGHEARSEFAGVEADVHGGIDAVEVIKHQHLAVILGHGDVAVFRHDEVEADDAGILRGDLKGEKSLSEDLLRREATEDLIEETYLYGASCSGVRLASW